MATLWVLFGSLLAYRALGAAGVAWLDSWPAATAVSLATMILFTGLLFWSAT